jgi:SAM-dependent MidA family methyltransferase
LTRVVAGSTPTPLARILAERIRSRGRITFAEYMEACLYHPQHGYYSTHADESRRDYITSVDVTPIFGRLLVVQFQQMWELMRRPRSFTLVEGGTGSGQLAKQILAAASDSGAEFYSALHYVAIERSAARRAAQIQNLQREVASGRFSSAAGLPAQAFEGCIFSNELLDAFPVHRVVQEGGKLREIYVALGDSGFCEEIGPPSSNAIAAYFDWQEITLREGQQAEANLAACNWIQEVASRLRRGFVLTVDYGQEARQLYDERHQQGTLLAYSNHRVSEDFYREPGTQDLTAHLNFTALDRCAVRAGLTPCGFTSQTNFLLALARHNTFAALEDPAATENQKTAARRAFNTLIHPEGMGETFRVALHHRGMDAAQLAGFEPL